MKQLTYDFCTAFICILAVHLILGIAIHWLGIAVVSCLTVAAAYLWAKVARD